MKVQKMYLVIQCKWNTKNHYLMKVFQIQKQSLLQQSQVRLEEQEVQMIMR